MANENETQSQQSVQDRIKQLLLEMGVLTDITPRLPPEAVPKNRRPIPIEGKPVSEIIIEERR